MNTMQATASVIVVLVGLPAVGKTTFSKSCKATLQLQEYKVTIFHYDELCKTFSADERKQVLSQVESFITKSQDMNIIIIDDNNYYKSMRDEYVKLCKKLSLGCLIVYFDVASLEWVLDNNLCRNVKEQVPEDIIIDMYNKLETPRAEKGVPVVCINVEIVEQQQYDFNVLRNKIEECSKNPLVQTEQHVVVPMPQSQLQQVDLALRRIVHKKILDLENKSKAKDFNRLKKAIYLKVCRKEIVISAFACDDVAESGILEKELGQYFV